MTALSDAGTVSCVLPGNKSSEAHLTVLEQPVTVTIRKIEVCEGEDARVFDACVFVGGSNVLFRVGFFFGSSIFFLAHIYFDWLSLFFPVLFNLIKR